MPDRDGHILFDADAIDRQLRNQSALAIGMGWGNSPENTAILQHILRNYSIPVVIDADGLNTLSEMDLRILKDTACSVILTPHPKEMARLCKRTVAEILQNPVEIAEAFAKEYGVCLLLKGASTIVTDGEQTYLVDRGSAGMATAGSGDVLSGILAGMLGWLPPTAKSIAAGAYLAGLAGELAAARVGEISMLASDTVAEIPNAIHEIQNR